MFKKSEAMTNPQKIFREPKYVVENDELSDQEKITILENWKLDLMELQKATEENMPGTGTEADSAGDELRAVIEALRIVRPE
jgi:nitrogen fixation protein